MSLVEGSRIVLQNCLNIKYNEKVLIVTDDDEYEIGKALYDEANNMPGIEAVMLTMKPNKVSGQEPPYIVAKAMEEVDCVVCVTKASLSHTNARINAVKKGVRIANMPGITKEMFSNGAVKADYKKVEKLTRKVRDLLTNAEKAKIVKEDHTLTMSLKGRKGVASTGVYKEPGASGNFPSGEAYIAPIEGTANGDMIIDGSMVGIGKIDEPLYIKIKDGRLISLKGKNTDKLQILFENEQNSSLCELGIGTNMDARITGNILEDEKVYGTIHIAFGTNISFGGTIKADCHIDGVILNPDLYLDEVLVTRNGKIIV